MHEIQSEESDFNIEKTMNDEKEKKRQLLGNCKMRNVFFKETQKWKTSVTLLQLKKT